MSEIEKMQRYIERTKKFPKTSRYQLNWKELMLLSSDCDTAMAICLAFDYGKAKGYRAAKAEVRK